MTCKDCKYLGVQPNRAGQRVVRNGSAYPCRAPEPTIIRLPASISEAHGWRWPPSRAWMSGNRGQGCPAWEPLP